jgi:hypothetical protein
MSRLNYGVYFTLDNGYSDYTKIDGRIKEDLESGSLNVNEVIDIKWLIEENQFNEGACVDSWRIEELSEEDIIDID